MGKVERIVCSVHCFTWRTTGSSHGFLYITQDVSGRTISCIGLSWECSQSVAPAGPPTQHQACPPAPGDPGVHTCAAPSRRRGFPCWALLGPCSRACCSRLVLLWAKPLWAEEGAGGKVSLTEQVAGLNPGSKVHECSRDFRSSLGGQA